MKKPTSRDIRRALRKFDWKDFNARVTHRLQMPRCNFYHGISAETQGYICSHWENWLIWGRDIYVKGKKTLTDYLNELREQIPEGFCGVEHYRIKNFLTSEA